MGMGYGANYADVVEQDELKKLVPMEFKALENAVLKEDDEDLDFYLSEIACGNDVPEEVQDAYHKIVDAVYEKTKMSVEVFYHNSEDHGDRYDEIEGVFWHVDNLYIENPQIPRGFRQKVTRNFFVTYG
jgi:hypothetical protein